MTRADLAARVKRLDERARGFANELLLTKADDLLHYAERRAYVTALHDAIDGFESARVVLATALRRLGG